LGAAVDDFQQQFGIFAPSPNCGNVTLLLACANGVLVAQCKARVTKMGWLRRSKWGACLALFALAMQLVLSFGHVHVGASSGYASGLEVAASSDTHKPAGNHHHHLPATPDENCALCALIHLASTLLPAAAPDLPLPAVFGRLPHHIVVQLDLSAASSAYFRARAPPFA
jgi:hypothetical protein